MGAPARLIVNIDVPDLAAAKHFYCGVFGCSVGRKFGGDAVELLGLEAPLYLLRATEGDRDYRRHWTPIHLDISVDDLPAASRRAVAAGAISEGGVREAGYGRIETFGDPFGHGFCLIQFNEDGYDAIAT